MKEFFKNLFTYHINKLSAKDAYLRVIYQCVKSDEVRVKEFIDDIDRLICMKCDSGSYCCVVEVRDDLHPYVDDIVDTYRNRGYTVQNLNEYLPYIGHDDYLFIYWKWYD